MKIPSLNKLLYACVMTLFVLTLGVTASSYAQDSNNGKQSGFEKGKHKGHSNENGKRKGHENPNNPWYDYYQDSAVDFDLLIHHHGLIPMMSFTISANSTMTVQQLLQEILGGSTGGFYLQECYEEGGLLMVTSDCSIGETTDPLNSDLTLESAGILDDPEVHLVYIPGS